MMGNYGIRQFVEDNYKLITVVGVFGALSAFLLNIKDFFSAFLALLIFLILCIELWIALPRSEEASMRLTFFEAIFYIFFLAIFFNIIRFVFESHKDLILLFCVCVILPIYVAITIGLIKHFEIFLSMRSICEKFPRIHPIIRGIIFSIIIFVPIVLTIITAKILQNYFAPV